MVPSGGSGSFFPFADSLDGTPLLAHILKPLHSLSFAMLYLCDFWINVWHFSYQDQKLHEDGERAVFTIVSLALSEWSCMAGTHE